MKTKLITGLLLAGVLAVHPVDAMPLDTAALDAVVEQHALVAKSAPAHPHTTRILNEAVAATTLEDPHAALEAVARAYPDSNLGLFALERRLAGDAPAAALLLALCADLPDTRLARFALDRQFASGATTPTSAFETYAGTGLQPFAALRAGDAACTTGDWATAERWFTAAGDLSAKSGLSGLSADRLEVLWNDHERWIPLALFSGRHHGMAIPRGVWTRYGNDIATLQITHAEGEVFFDALWDDVKPARKTLERFLREADDYPLEWQLLSSLRLARWHFHVGRIDVAAALLELVYDRLPPREAPRPEDADLGVAVFLLGEGSHYYHGPPPKEVPAALERLVALGRLAAIRERFLVRAQEAFPLLTPEERVYFANLLARRHVDEGNVARAQLALVEALGEEADVPAYLRKRTEESLLQLRNEDAQ